MKYGSILSILLLAGQASFALSPGYCNYARAPLFAPHFTPSQPYHWGTLATKCNTYTGTLCISGQMSGLFQFDSTWYTVYVDTSHIHLNDTVRYSTYQSQIFHGFPKGLQLKNAKVSICDGVTDSLLLSTFDSTFILFPDSIPVSVGDTVMIDYYFADWTQQNPEGFSHEYSIYIEKGTFTVNGVRYEQPLPLLHTKHQHSGVTVARHPEGLRVTNQEPRNRTLRLVGVDGKTSQALQLAPNESRFVKTNQTMLVMPQ